MQCPLNLGSDETGAEQVKLFRNCEAGIWA